MIYQSYLLQIVPQTDLIIGTKEGWGNEQTTLDHIPGRVLRGAIGERIFRQNAALHDRIFDGQNEPIFGHAYPGQKGPIFPLPLTARTCKRFSGFWQEENRTRRQEAQHGITDHLIADFVYELVSDPQFPQRSEIAPELGRSWSEKGWFPANRSHQYCEICDDEDMTPIDRGGYYAWQNGITPIRDSFAVGRTTHSGINRARGVSEDRVLFSEEHLASPDQGSGWYFFGWLHIPQHKVSDLEPYLNDIYAIGRGRSRGLGQIQISTSAQPRNYPDLSRRVKDFNAYIRLAIRHYQKHEPRLPAQIGGQFFSLTLNGPAVLNDAGHIHRTPSTQMLGLPEGTRLIRSWARMSDVGGWDNGAGLPRPTNLAVTTGAVYLYYAPESANITELWETLGRLEIEGIGTHRELGYGQLTVCAPIHAYQQRY